MIQDVQHILSNLGHTVDRHSLSGHNWVDGSAKSKLKVVTSRSWPKIDSDMATRFYKRYRAVFEGYDAFIHSYPPAFALLFERFEKPVITVTCTRFDFPAFPESYQWLVEGLRRMSSSGQLTLTANNRLDQMYNERFLGIETQYISSLCDYMEQKTITTQEEFLCWSRYHPIPQIRGLDQNFSIQRKYDRNSIRESPGVVHLPYNLSIMSAFEHYWQNIPMYFPSIDFQRRLYNSPQGSLEEVLFAQSALFFDESMIQLADWYDSENFAGVRLFDSWEDLEGKLATDDLPAIKNTMAKKNLERKLTVYTTWEKIMARV